MEWINLITILIGGGGLAGFAATVYQARKSSHSAAAKTEVEAASQETANWDTFTKSVQGHMNFLERQVQNLRGEVQDLKEDRAYDREHIRILQRQIYAGIGPPPLKPGEWPENEVGG